MAQRETRSNEAGKSTLGNIFIIGCGDIGNRVASLAHSTGCLVSALNRSPEKEELLRSQGIAVVPGNLDEPSTLLNLPIAGATVFYFAPPPGGGIVDPRMRNFCDAVSAGPKPSKVVYLSTSGVYGDCGEMTVTEETPPNPQTARARRRLDAETTLTCWGEKRGVPVVILRVTGIYGPGRLPIRHLMNGAPLLNEDESPITNRIHADDLAKVVLLAGEKGDGGDIFNVSDGEHGTMTGYFNAIADSLGIPRPGQVTKKEAAEVMPPLLYSYFSESRRIDNSKMLRKLGIKLRYPTLAEGLSSCIPEDWQPPGIEGR